MKSKVKSVGVYEVTWREIGGTFEFTDLFAVPDHQDAYEVANNCLKHIGTKTVKFEVGGCKEIDRVYEDDTTYHVTDQLTKLTDVKNNENVS